MSRMLCFIQRQWLPITLLHLLAISILSLWPAELLPQVPGSDKTHHLLAYALLMFPSALRKPRHWLLLSLLFIGWGGAIELIQPYVNRYGEWLDLAANGIGVCLGYAAARLAARWMAADARLCR